MYCVFVVQVGSELGRVRGEVEEVSELVQMQEEVAGMLVWDCVCVGECVCVQD